MASETVRTWAEPVEATDVQVAFAASTRGYLPPKEEIPEEFWRFRGNEWNRLFNQWFYRGLDAPPRFKPGIDQHKALRHLRICMASFEPKHEHKEAGVAYLLSLWCEPEAATASIPNSSSTETEESHAR